MLLAIIACAPFSSFATNGVWKDGVSGLVGVADNWTTMYSGTTPVLTFANSTAGLAFVTNNVTTTFGNVCFSKGDFSFHGTAKLNCAQVQIPSVANNVASVTKTGGDWNLSAALLPAYQSNSVGAFTNKAGTVTCSNILRLCYFGGANSYGECVVEGGSMTFAMGYAVPFGDTNNHGADSKGLLIVENGSAAFNTEKKTEANNRAVIGRGKNSTGTVIVQNGGTITVGNNVATYLGSDVTSLTGSSGTLILNEGGTYITRNVYAYASGGGSVIFNGGTLKANAAYSSGLIQNIDVIAVKVGEKGGIIDTGGYAIIIDKQIVADGDSTGGMTIKGGGTLTTAAVHGYTGTTTIEVGTKVVVSNPASFPGGIALAMPENASKGKYDVLVSTGGEFTDGFVNAIALPTVSDNETCELALSADSKTISLTYAYKSGFWTGAKNNDLRDGENWSDGVVPNGTPAYIYVESATTLVCDGLFSPSSLTFLADSAKVTVDGAGAISGVAAVTNNVAQNHRLNVPVTFDGDLRTVATVSGGAIDYAGGVTGGRIVADNSFSRVLMGHYTMTDMAIWPAEVGAGGETYQLSGAGSTLFVPLACLKRFTIDAGTTVTVSRVVHNQNNYYATVSANNKNYYYGLLTYANHGVLRVGEITTDGNAEVFTAYDASKFTGKVVVDRLLYGATAKNGAHSDYFHLTTGHRAGSGQDGFGATEWVIGPGGIGFDTTKALRCQDQWFIAQTNCTLRSYADWTLAANPSNRVVSTAHSLSVGENCTVTLDTSHFPMGDPLLDTADSHTITLEGTINSSGGVAAAGGGKVVFAASSLFTGGLTATDSVTVSCEAGCSPGNGATTLNGTSTLEVAQSGTVALGGNLTLGANAMLAFRFTERTTAPTLSIPADSTIPGTVNVRISAAENVKVSAKQAYAITSGYDFTGKMVNLVDKPDWLKSVDVDESGNLVMKVKCGGMMILVR